MREVHAPIAGLHVNLRDMPDGERRMYQEAQRNVAPPSNGSMDAGPLVKFTGGRIVSYGAGGEARVISKGRKQNNKKNGKVKGKTRSRARRSASRS